MDKSARESKDNKPVGATNATDKDEPVKDASNEYHLDCICGLGRIYRTWGVARAMMFRFADRYAFGPSLYHNVCGGELILSTHPVGTTTDDYGQPTTIPRVRMEYHLNCTCGLGRIYSTRGVARAMRSRFADKYIFGPGFYHKGCRGKLTLSLHPVGTITDGHGRPMVITRKKPSRRF